MTRSGLSWPDCALMQFGQKQTERVNSFATVVVTLRREIRNRGARAVSKNSVWGLDLTTVTDMTKTQRLVLGIVDHGTRA